MTNEELVVQNLTLLEAIEESKRCLHCKKPLCKQGCPIENDIPEFIAELAKGNLGEAYNIIANKSNLPAVCGRVCPHELQCEGHCILNKKGQGIRVGEIERVIADFNYDMHLEYENIAPKTRGKIAVIGSGPAGLTVAGDLAKIGFHVSVFESEPEPGGVLLYGIPEFRLPKVVVRREIDHISAQGVTFTNNTVAGVDFTIDDLFDQQYDAIFIGTGTAVDKSIDLPNSDLTGIIQANYLLRTISLFNSDQLNRDEVSVSEDDHVLVIGGGNVAMDAARSAKRFNAASVTVVYYKKQEDMSALKAEIDGAIEDGVKFAFESSPVRFIGNDGVVEGLEVETPDGLRIIPASKIFLAVGSRPANRIVSTTEGIDVDERGYVISREKPYGMTTRRGVFAGGDVVHSPATVVLAMKDAKQVAEGIASYVDAVKLLEA